MPRDRRDWLTILWAGFVAAAFIELVVFAAFDPQDLQLIAPDLAVDRETVYSVAFFVFWAICSGCALLAWSLLRTPSQVNREGDPTPSAPPR